MKAKRKYVRVKDRNVGLPVKDRPLKSERNANQWVITPKQLEFARLYFDPKSETYSNAYQSALAAGYSRSMAVQIVSRALDLQWVKDARRRLINFTPEHTIKGYEHLAVNAKRDTDKLHALDSLARIQGLFIDRSIRQIDVQFTNAVPRPVIEVVDTAGDNTISKEK